MTYHLPKAGDFPQDVKSLGSSKPGEPLDSLKNYLREAVSRIQFCRQHLARVVDLVIGTTPEAGNTIDLPEPDCLLAWADRLLQEITHLENQLNHLS